MDNNTQANYFTPDLEDLRVGYECEIKVHGEDDKWIKTIFATPDFSSVLSKDDKGNYSVPDCLRVSYLTREQIEAEGWVHVKDKHYKKGVYELIQIVDTVKIYKTIRHSFECNTEGEAFEHVFYWAECKDINTFRLISKLLAI